MINRVAFEIFGKEIMWYGIIIAAAVVIACFLGTHLAKKKGYKSDLIFDFVILALPLAIVGARLYYVIFEWARYAANPISMLYIWEGGLAIYGGVLGGVIAAWIFCKWKKFSFAELIDIASPGLILAQSIGRWGNFANQEAFGEPILNTSLQYFPYGVYIDNPGVINSATGLFYEAGWFQATFFYESMWNLLGFIVLMFYFKRAKNRGNVFALYLVFYGLGRAFIESLRTDSLWLIPGVIRASVLVSILMVAFGLLYIFVISKKLKPFEYSGKYCLNYTEAVVNEEQTATGAKEESKEQAAEEIADQEPQANADITEQENIKTGKDDNA